MNYKILGMILVISGCGGFGFYLSYMYRRTEKIMRQFLGAVDFMECELQYRMTPLPELCCEVGKQSTGCLKTVFMEMSKELNNQILPDAKCCMDAVLCSVPDLPKQLAASLHELGQTLGRFDLNGQILGLERVRETCRRELQALSQNKQRRLQSYQTLGLCAGAALAILFI